MFDGTNRTAETVTAASTAASPLCVLVQGTARMYQRTWANLFYRDMS